MLCVETLHRIVLSVYHRVTLRVRDSRLILQLCKTLCRLSSRFAYITSVRTLTVVPKLWTTTIETHRREVRDAILDTTAALAEHGGLLSMTMSQIAEEAGIGRATLYKYFSDVEAILLAWHEREVTAHLARLAKARDQAGDPAGRLRAVLETYALITQQTHGHHDAELSALLHRKEHVGHAEQHLRDMVCDLLTEGAKTGQVRDDVEPEELANYCLHALTAASRLPSAAAVRRLVAITLAGVTPPPC